MKYKKIFIMLILSLSTQVFADNRSDSDKIFNWAEKVYPQYFSPSGSETFEISGYLAREYSETGNYLGTKEGRVYVLGDIFGGLVEVGEFPYFLDLIDSPVQVTFNDTVSDRLGNYIGTGTNTIFNCNSQINNNTTLSKGNIEIINIKNDQTFNGQGDFSANLSGFVVKEHFDIIGKILSTGELTGSINSSAFIDGVPAGTGTTSFTGQINNNEMIIQFPEQELGIDNCISSGTRIKVIKQ